MEEPLFNSNFTEDAYVAVNADVARAIASGRLASGWTHFVRHGRKEKRRGADFKRPFFFCHIPKTAGTSVRLCLEGAFPAHSVMPDAMMMARQNDSYPGIETIETLLRHQIKAVRMLRGHYPFAARTLLPDAITITVLREPVSRSVSHLQHRIASGVIDREATLAALSEGKFPGVDNLMTRFLSAAWNDAPEAGNRPPVTEAMLETAIGSLDEVDILGLAENLESFAAKLSDALGVVLPAKRYNVALTILELDEVQIETIRVHNRLDTELYGHAIAKV